MYICRIIKQLKKMKNENEENENQLTITVTDTVERTYNVFLPCYRKDNLNFYKVEKEFITVVQTWTPELGIRKSAYMKSCAFGNDSKECTEEEFMEAKTNVLNQIQKWS